MAKAVSKKTNMSTVMVKHLSQALSDTYVLAVKAHVYHWNVKGPSFGALHAFFEEQYKALVVAADDLAERIRALGPLVDGGMSAFLKETVIKEAGTKPMDARSMLKDLLNSYQQLRARLVDAEDVADEMDDLVTQDLIVGQLSAYDKTMWMIKSQIG